ncbi:MAG: iron ABC transporter permease [Bacteroidaceae bacterium]|nr:iron ABC transporter permease [Bacteroidaceae bacterium]
MNKSTLWLTVLSVMAAALVLANILCGSVDVSLTAAWQALTGQDTHSTASIIILHHRLPQAIAALLGGAALAVSGLLLQTAFSNPLADPSILGINSGASLGVGIAVIVMGGSLAGNVFSLSGFLLTVLAALAGAAVVILLLLFFSSLVQGNLMLLIIGLMLSYAASSLISMLNYLASADSLQAFVIWGLGSFGGISVAQLPAFSITIAVGLLASLMLVKPLNALLLGHRYAANLGVNVRRTRALLLLTTGILSATVTAFCGPIAFLGLAVPHVARMLLGTVNHRSLLPTTLLCGSVIALACNLLCNLPTQHGLLPINVVTPLFGVPIILYVLLGRRRDR